MILLTAAAICQRRAGPAGASTKRETGMLNRFRSAAIAATLTLTPAPGASFGLSSGDLPAAAPQAVANNVVPAPVVRIAPPPPEFGLHAHDHGEGSGLAPGQDADAFRSWLARSPANRARLAAFEDRL